MRTKATFKRKLLASAVASCALAGMGAQTAAQEGVIEEVVVTGIRASLERSMDVKRNAAGVVDAITAEDIGKFPDANLAESLQRITGVSVDRIGGEGSQVTVRGFGPDNNMVTLNGRTMPVGFVYGGGSGAGGTFGGAPRSFDFANLASESVSGVQVYKTGRASMPTGGLGAAVNINTVRPLDTDPFTGAISAKLLHDTTASDGSGDDVTPEVSGLFSWANNENTFGVAVSASYSQRHFSYAGGAANNWNVARWDAAAHAAGENQMYSWRRDGDGNINATLVNEPHDGQLYARPNDFRWTFSERERERTNAQLTLQWAPIEDVTVTADYTYAETETWEHRGEWTMWIGNSSTITNVEFDNSGQIAVPINIEERIGGGKDMGYEQQWREQTNTLNSFGINVDWRVNDDLTLNFDLHDSSMDNRPTGPGNAGEIGVSVGAPIGDIQRWNFAGDLPQGYYTFDNSHLSGTQHPSQNDFGTQQGRVFYALQEMDVTQVQLSGAWAMGDGELRFGMEYRDTEVRQANSTREHEMGNWGVANPGEFAPLDNLQPFNFASVFSDYNTDLMADFGIRSNNVLELCQHMVGLTGEGANYPRANPDPWACAAMESHPNNNTVEEEMLGLFVEYAHSFQIGGMDANILAGLRYEETDVASTALSQIPAYRPWQNSNDFQLTIWVQDDEGNPVLDNFTLTHDYSNILPSLDFDIALRDDLIARFSASRTIGRPGYGNLFASVGNFQQDNPTYLGGNRSASANTPELDPLESTNVDVSLEWYFDDASYVSLGVFHKKVDNFLGVGVDTRPHFDLRDPSAGPLVEQAAAELQARGIPVDNRTLFVMTGILHFADDHPGGAQEIIDTYGADGSGVGFTEAEAFASAYNIPPRADSPLVEWRTTLPINNRDATIRGAEFALQHFFGDTGFGVQFNYTHVDSNRKFDDFADPGEEQFALVGLSDTANVVLMYENYGVEARLAYNWRDEFLRQTNQGGSNNPVYVDAYAQLDLSVAYNINDNLSVFFEGLNLTEENVRWRTRDSRMTQYLEQHGARYMVGVRYAF